MSIVWPSFRGTAKLVGTASGVSVYVDAHLGASALKNAEDLLADAPRIVAANNQIFGITGGPVNVIVFALNGVTDGTGGADHMGCTFQNGGNIEVDASYGSSLRCSALFEAELSECAMNGQLCGLSTGEALSRWCAMAVSNDALSDYATAPAWAKKLTDFVDHTAQTDGNELANGCGVAFISWLIAAHNETLASIAQEMVKLGDRVTFRQLYHKLTGLPATSAFPDFVAAVKALPHGVTNDDPFGGLSHAIPAMCAAQSHPLRR